MGDVYTLPSKADITRIQKQTPAFMRPNDLPFAVVYRGYLTEQQCRAIVQRFDNQEPYHHSARCGAITREILPSGANPIPNDPLNLVEDYARYVNHMYWNYDLDPIQASWLQTYEKDGDYDVHLDAAPGQNRKLTAVVMLSEGSEYIGGNLEVIWPPLTYTISRERGTVVVFPAWLHHQVTKVLSGTRQTINMGFWGPPFR